MVLLKLESYKCIQDKQVSLTLTTMKITSLYQQKPFHCFVALIKSKSSINVLVTHMHT